MVATGNVEITDTGRVSGNIETDSLVISKGGFFNGNVSKMGQSSGKTEERRGGPELVTPAAMDKKSSSENSR